MFTRSHCVPSGLASTDAGRAGLVAHSGAGGRVTPFGLATTPFRTVADLLADGESPDSVAHVVADSFRAGYADAQALASAIAPHARRSGLRPGDGLALLEWLADLTGDTDVDAWVTGTLGATECRHDEVHALLPVARTLPEALGRTRPFLDPLLQETASGVWNPEAGAWE